MIRELSDEDYDELVWFADWRVQYLQKINALPESSSAPDFVQSALLEAIKGKRKYDPARGELVPWLKSQIRSLIWNARDYHRRRPESRYPESDDPEYVEDKLSFQAVEDGVFGDSIGINPEDIIIAKEEEEEAGKVVGELYQTIQGEPELEGIIDALLNGCEPKPRYLATELGVSVQEVHNRVNKLRRRFLRLKEAQ